LMYVWEKVALIESSSSCVIIKKECAMILIYESRIR